MDLGGRSGLAKRVLDAIKSKAARANATLVFDRRWYPDEPVLMSRMDSDDFVFSRFVEKIQRAAEGDGRVPLAVDSPKGWKTDRRRAWPYFIPGSPFVSLAANPHKDGDVWQCSHRELVRRFPCVTVPGLLWCIVIHGDNLLNRVTGGGPNAPGLPLLRLGRFLNRFELTPCRRRRSFTIRMYGRSHVILRDGSPQSSRRIFQISKETAHLTTLSVSRSRRKDECRSP